MRVFVLQLLGMALAGSLAALAVSLACPLLRRSRAPAWLTAALWLVVALRFLAPWGLPINLPVPQNAAAAQAVETLQAWQAPAPDGQPTAPATPSPAPQAAAPQAPARGGSPIPTPMLSLWGAVGAAWLCGTLAFAGHGAADAFSLGRRLRTACKTADGAFTAPDIAAPFTFGVLRPRIYLPSALSGAERAAVLRHEQAHIRRRDPAAKLVFYLAACLHWWNPIAWLAFRAFSREMEAACDQAATCGLSAADRTAYCRTLLGYAVGSPAAKAPAALAFGSGSLKARIDRVLQYKKPGRAALVLCCLAAAGVFTACMTSPQPARAAALQAPPQTAQETTFRAAQGTDQPEIDQLQAEIGALNTQLAETEAALSAYDSDTQPSYVDLYENTYQPAYAQREALLARLAALALGAFTPAQGPWQCPLPAGSYTVDRLMTETGHKGDDLLAPAGTPVGAAAAGLVVTAGSHDSYGNYVVVLHGTDADTGESWTTLYAHLESLTVQPGQLVTAGQQLGTEGSTGNSSSVHLHWELCGSVTGLAEPAAYLGYDQSPAQAEVPSAFLCPLEKYKAVSAPYDAETHPGLDLAADRGTPVLAAAAGTVTQAAYDEGKGNYVVLAHENGVDTVYSALDTLAVTAGEAVAAGQQLGTVGSTGLSTGPHLHLEVHVDGAAIDPLTVLPAQP